MTDSFMSLCTRIEGMAYECLPQGVLHDYVLDLEYEYGDDAWVALDHVLGELMLRQDLARHLAARADNPYDQDEHWASFDRHTDAMTQLRAATWQRQGLLVPGANPAPANDVAPF